MMRLILFVQGPLKVGFFTLIDPYIMLMSCLNPGQNLTTTVREQHIFKTIAKPRIHHTKQKGSRITFMFSSSFTSHV